MEQQLSKIADYSRTNQTITSLEISKLTGKPHNDLMKAIRKMEPAWEKATEGKFSRSTYKDSTGRSLPCFELTKIESLYVATRFDNEMRAKLVLRWEQLEREQLQQQSSQVIALPDFTNPAEAARAWAEQYEGKLIEKKRADDAEQQVYTLSLEVESMQQKVNYYDTILASKETVTTTQIAQDYGMSAIAFNKLLADLRVQHKVNGQWILYAPYLGQGYVQSKPVEFVRSDGRKDCKLNTEWTQKGRLFLYECLKNHNMIPLIER